jgi:hypothetical protein
VLFRSNWETAPSLQSRCFRVSPWKMGWEDQQWLGTSRLGRHKDTDINIRNERATSGSPACEALFYLRAALLISKRWIIKIKFGKSRFWAEFCASIPVSSDCIAVNQQIMHGGGEGQKRIGTTKTSVFLHFFWVIVHHLLVTPWYVMGHRRLSLSRSRSWSRYGHDHNHSWPCPGGLEFGRSLLWRRGQLEGATTCARARADSQHCMQNTAVRYISWLVVKVGIGIGTKAYMWQVITGVCLRTMKGGCHGVWIKVWLFWNTCSLDKASGFTFGVSW